MKLFLEKKNDFQHLTIFANKLYKDVRQDSKSASDYG